MEHIVHILSITLCTFACTAAFDPYGTPVPSRRSPAYAGDFLQEYEPYAYAAIPLHSQVQVLHVVSPPNHHSKYKARKQPVRPQPEREYVYAATSNEDMYEPYSQEYADTVTKPKYASLYEDDAEPIYVYARPNKNGGYTYRRPALSKISQQKEPFVVRIHKYKVSRD